MKAIQVSNKTPHLVDVPEPIGEGVKVRIVSASICASDFHAMDLGIAEGKILGHELAGYTENGTAVAIEPVVGCGVCDYCGEGHPGHCVEQLMLMGITQDGGMAERIIVPPKTLVELPSGLDIRIASLVEPLSVAAHGIDQSGARQGDRVLVIGAGSIGLAVAAVLQARGIVFDISARHPRQQESATRLGGNLSLSGHYDVVIDAVGSEASVEQAVKRVKPRGRIALVGSFWEPTKVPGFLCNKEVSLVGSLLYKTIRPNRTFDEAGRILADNPSIAAEIISHRYPLDAVSEGFGVARDRASGAIKVCFDVASPLN